jgi:hypothetical protein
MPRVFDLEFALNGLSGATAGFEESMSRDANREYLDSLRQRIDQERLQKENEALREEKRMEGLKSAAQWAQKWMGRERVDTSKGLSPDAMGRIAGVGRRGPLAFGAAYGSEWARELNTVLEEKRREAEQITAQMDPRDAAAFMEDQKAEAREEVELAAKEAVKRGLARFVSNATRAGFDEGSIDNAEQIATLLDEGAIDVAEAEQFLFQSMDALATERANQRATERTIARIDQMGAESQDPKWYEDLASDVEGGLLTADDAFRQARERFYGLDGSITVDLPGVGKRQSRTELFRGNGRPSSSMPKSARAESFLLGGEIAASEPGYDELSLEERRTLAAEKTALLTQMGGWELDDADRELLEGAGDEGASWEALPPAQQEFARQALLDAAAGGATEDELRAVLEGLGIPPEAVPQEVQEEVAAAYKQRSGERAKRESGGRPAAPPGLTPNAPAAPLERPGYDPFASERPPPGAAQPSFPPRAGTARPGSTPDPKKLQDLLKALKGGRR